PAPAVQAVPAAPDQRQLAPVQRKPIEAEPVPEVVSEALPEPEPGSKPEAKPEAQAQAGERGAGVPETPEPSPWFQAAPPEQVPYEGGYDPEFPVPAGPGRTRPLSIPGPRTEAVPEQPETERPEAERRETERRETERPEPQPEAEQPEAEQPEPGPKQPTSAAPAPTSASSPAPTPTHDLPEDISREEAYFGAFRKYVSEHKDMPNARQLAVYLLDLYGVTGQSGGPLSESTLRPYVREFRGRYQEELDADAEPIA
ncbi:hypothetical protein QIS99_30610, partial [Streptomyces sp. B-S-A8]|nr:hypothetical protein [Streptomyces sp. B-S-A8]